MIRLKNFLEDTLKKLREYLEAVRLKRRPGSGIPRSLKKAARWPVAAVSQGAGPGEHSLRLLAPAHGRRQDDCGEPMPSGLPRKATSKRITRLCYGWCPQIRFAHKQHRPLRTPHTPTASRWMKPLMAECACLKPRRFRTSARKTFGTVFVWWWERFNLSALPAREGRDVYAHKEALEDHFTKLNTNLPGLERIENGAGAGKVAHPFANLMMVHQPLIITDEAHNARTSLTFDMLQRLSPSAIIELTATPEMTRARAATCLPRVGI